MINEFLAEVQQLQEANEMMASIIEANEYQEKLDLAISLYEASDISIMESANGDINAIFKDLQKQYKAGVKEAKAAIKTGDTKAAKAKINELIKICEEGKKKVSAVEGGNGSGFFKSFGLAITTATLTLAAGTATFFGGTDAAAGKIGGKMMDLSDKIDAKAKATGDYETNRANIRSKTKDEYKSAHAALKASKNLDKAANRMTNNSSRLAYASGAVGTAGIKTSDAGNFVSKHKKAIAIATVAASAIAALTAVVKGLKTSHDTKANGREASGNAYKDKVLNALDADINQLKKLASSL